MVVFDIVFLAVAGLIVFKYATRGFIGSVLEFAKIYLAFLLAHTLGGVVGGLLGGMMPNAPDFIGNVIGYVVVFVLAILLLPFVVGLLNGVLKQIKLVDRVNSLLGLLLGVLMSFAFLLIVSSVFKTFFVGQPIYEDTVVLKFFGESGILESLKIFDISAVLF